MIATSQRRIRPRIFAMGLHCRQSLVLVVLCGSLLLAPIALTRETEILIKSAGPNSPRSGQFASPLWPNKYPSGQRSRFKFVARYDERVMLKFEHFNVEGLSPDCVKDFVDIYIQLHSIEAKLSETIQHGRFCGHTLSKVPQVLVSMYNVIVLDFYTDQTTQKSYNHDDHMGKLGFNGTYQFIPAGPYSIGSPLTHFRSTCSFKIKSVNNLQGRIMSPTYPGVYPNYLNCTYLFEGRKTENERVRISFDDFDLYERSKSCPVDYIEIFDGLTRNRSKRIGHLFCGQQQNLVIYSTTTQLRLEFITGKGRANTEGKFVIPYRDNKLREKIQNRGFSAIFQFSGNYVKIVEDGLKQNHYRGTECDFFIKSNGTSHGVVYSPNYPSRMAPNKICTYFVYGIFNKQNRERVELQFEKFDFPKRDADGVCRKGHLAIFKSAQAYSQNAAHVTLCGSKLTDSEKFIDTERESQLIMVLNTTNLPDKGQFSFKAHYWFQVEFGISGKSVTTGSCHFLYDRKNNGPNGFINSPFYPDHYPVNRTCRYDLRVTGQEYVRLTFHHFHTADKPMEDVDAKEYHKAGMNCTRDYLDIAETVANLTTGALEERRIVKYCAIFIPGPWVTDIRSTSLILRFYSNHNRTTTGFQAEYEFLPKPRLFEGSCGGNLTSDKHGGVIVSPKYPIRYPPGLTCEWHIHPSEPGHILMLHFADFEIEGSPRSCSYAILRIYEGDDVLPHSELCGTDTNIPAFTSKARFLRVRFLTSKKSNGAKGFKISWTELLPPIQGRCGGFKCLMTGYCIDPSLECNGVPNCGTYSKRDKKTRVNDHSDEALNSGHCRNASLTAGPVTASYNLLHVGIGILLTVIILVVIVVSILYREHRRTQLKQKDPLGEGAASKRLVVPGTPSSPPCNDLCPTQPPEVFSLTYRNGCGGGTLTREKMQKISIV